MGRKLRHSHRRIGLDPDGARFTCAVVSVKKGFDCMPVQYCCPEMREAWADDFIGYGPHEMLCAENEGQLCVYQATEYQYGGMIWDRMSISYCPFCGAEIVFEGLGRAG